MTPEVKAAIQELESCFPEAEVVTTDTGDGGADVCISQIDLGSMYAQRETWLKFTISFQYPYADVYPLFVRPDLSRADGQEHGEGISLQEFKGEPAIQLSRRSNRLNPASDTAAVKVIKVLEWLRSQ